MIRMMKYGEVPNSEIFARSYDTGEIDRTVSEIIADVRANGDAAVRRYTERFDGAVLEDFLVSEAKIDAAVAETGPELVRIFERAAANIRRFHEKQLRNNFMISEEGVVMGQRVLPIEKVGLYVPGGTASLPSAVLMDAIPAKIAGVPQLVMVTPPDKNGRIAPVILAAARVAGVDRIYKMGGAQAVAALAYGTETVPKVDKIVGPGSAYVAMAKKQVFGAVAIDMVAGPSEVLIVADARSDPHVLAADMLAQAEHDRLATSVLVTDSPELAEAVRVEIEEQLPKLAREEIARTSIDNNGKIIIAEDIKLAIDIANEIAPEHFELCVDDPFAWMDSVKNAGSLFLGRNTPEALGDYMAGPNHTLPTLGTARFSSPLSVDDFIKKMQFSCFSEDALAGLADDIAAFAKAEGLTAHARSALVRFGREDEV